MDVLDKAIVFAVKAHEGALRKGNDTPYILHVLEAAAIAATMTCDRDIMAAAALHDTVEDTDVTEGDILREFGERIAALVCAETENKRQDIPAEQTWYTRKKETIDFLTAEASHDVMIVTLSDKLSNVRSMYRDHLRLGDALWDRFHQKDPCMHYWYYKSIADALSPLREHAAYDEYLYLIDKLFGNCRI